MAMSSSHMPSVWFHSGSVVPPVDGFSTFSRTVEASAAMPQRAGAIAATCSRMGLQTSEMMPPENTNWTMVTKTIACIALSELDTIVEQSLQRAAIWDEVKDDFRKKSGLALSGGQQQRLCIARTLATGPEVILMDEPCSALDPIATLRIEELITELRADYTILIVTHNMQQAALVSDRTAFFSLGEDKAGYLVEEGATAQIFTNPKNQLTEDYVSGRFG